MHEYKVTHTICEFKKTKWAAGASNMKINSEAWQEEERERPNF